MGWMETCAMDERMRLVIAVEKREESFSALCRRFNVSRKTGYKWLSRYDALGVEGLSDLSRAPHGHPHAIPATIAERCLQVRREHSTWGPAKVSSMRMPLAVRRRMAPGGWQGRPRIPYPRLPP